MDNERKERLSQFVKRNTESQVLSRGRSIFSSGGYSVVKLDYNGNGYAEFKVRSDYSIQSYLVKISDFLTPNITTSCNCPDSYGGLCKHRVAMILYVLDKMPAYVKPTLHEMADSTAVLPAIKDNYLEDLVTRETWLARNQPAKTDLLSTRDGFADCSVTMKEVEFLVQFNRIENSNQIKTACSCKQTLYVPLCEHKLAALFKLRDQFGERAFEMMRDWTEDKNALLAEYGYSLEDNLENKFDFKVDQNGILKLVQLDRGIQKIGVHQNWEGLRNQVIPESSAVYQVSDLDKSGVGDERVSLYVFWPNGSHNVMDFGFGIFSAKSSSKTQKYTHIRSIAGGSGTHYMPEEIPVLTAGDSRLVRIARQFSGEGLTKYMKNNGVGSVSDESPEYKREAHKWVGRYVERIFRDLSEERVFVSDGDYVTNQTQLQEMKVLHKPMRLLFVLTEDKEFITLNPYVEIEKGKPIDLQQVLTFSSFWLGVYQEDKLFRWADINNAEMVDFLRHNGYKVRVRKEYAENFLKDWVMPVAEQFEVVFQTRHAVETQSMTMARSRVYLKEDEANLLIVPGFVYEDESGKETEFIYDHRNTKAHFGDNQITLLERDVVAEKELWQWVESLHPDFAHQTGHPFFFIPFEEVMKDGWLFHFVDTIKEKDISLLGFKDLKKMRINPNRGTVQIRASSGIDWFDMQIEITFGDQKVSLADAKKALLKKQNYVELSDGSMGMLPEEWISKLEPLLKFGRVDGDEVHLSKFHFSLIEQLTDQIDNEEVLQELWEKKQKLLNFKEIADVPLPANINVTMRQYQEEGYKWLHFLDEFGWGGCLADDMGLGKTVQMLTFLQEQKNRAAGRTNLVVVPTTLIFNWQAESAKFTPDLRLYVHRGMDRRKDFDFFHEYDIILTTYGTMRSDVELLRKFDFHYIVLDESQAIKNPDSLTAKASRLLKAHNRLTMTGTPVENNTFDLYSQFEFLNPGLLGYADFFRAEYALPIDKFQDKEKAEELRRLVYPFMLKRTKEEVATDLPDKTETILYCEMGKKQRKVYETIREKYRQQIAEKLATDGLNKSNFLIFEALLKLRQICDSPLLLSDDVDYGNESAKLEEITREIEENASNHKILIFSQFLGMLDLIRQHLEKIGIPYEYLDGQTVDRAGRVNRFQNDQNCRVFLMSLKAGGVGLNLTEADYVYLMDPWWNPAVERQAIDRTHRIGQTRKVFAYKMICKDTIEEKILLLQERKQELAEDLVGGEAGFIKKLTQEDIMGLFS
jgi:non-specific serine/threonine protein kinase